jgi:transcription factor TFIIIB component B''
MSSMIKKKGTLSFKPKAPQARRPPGAPPSAPSSSCQSVERQSQTPAPQAASPPSISVQNEGPLQEAIASQEAAHILPTPQISEAITTEALGAANDPETIDTHGAETTTEAGNHIASESTPHTTPPDDNQEVSHIQYKTAPTLASTVPSDSAALEPPEPSIQNSQSTNGTVPVPRSTAGLQGVGLSVLGAGEVDLPSQLVPTASQGGDGASAVTATPKPLNRPKRPAKRRRLDDNDAEIRPSIEVSVDKPRRRASRKPRQPGEGGKKRKQREDTPSDAEEREVDHTTVKMADLTRDIKIGKKFSRHTEIKEREKEKQVKSRLAKDHPELVQAQVRDDSALNGAAGQEAAPIEVSTGPQMRIVNGQIVVDDASLVVDRHAIAAAAATDMEEVEEDDFTRITTSGTFMKRERNTTWNLESTEKFYLGLRMFGTDFEMISKMFPDRNRRQIKLKFNKEEREFPRRIANALVGETVKIDFEEYKSHTGLEYETVADIEAEHAKFEEEHLEEQRRLQAEAAEMTRQKKAEIQGRSAIAAPGPAPGSRATPAAGTESAKENEPEGSATLEGGKASAASKSKKKAANKKKKRNLHSVRGGGEEVEVLGSIE